MDAAFLDVVTRGTVLGLAAGFSPGPLTLLVISETLRHGLGAGVRVSLAPLLTDLPLIVLSVLLLERLAAVPAAAGVIALAGAAFLFYLGVGSLRLKAVAAAAGRAARAVARQGRCRQLPQSQPLRVLDRRRNAHSAQRVRPLVGPRRGLRRRVFRLHRGVQDPAGADGRPVARFPEGRGLPLDDARARDPAHRLRLPVPAGGVAHDGGVAGGGS